MLARASFPELWPKHCSLFLPSCPLALMPSRHRRDDNLFSHPLFPEAVATDRVSVEVNVAQATTVGVARWLSRSIRASFLFPSALPSPRPSCRRRRPHGIAKRPRGRRWKDGSMEGGGGNKIKRCRASTSCFTTSRPPILATSRSSGDSALRRRRRQQYSRSRGVVCYGAD